MGTGSLLVGFLVGTATGASGPYFAELFTDKRREKHARKRISAQWRELESRFPKLISEMRQDASKSGCEGIREFFTLRRGLQLNIQEPCFIYRPDDHPDLTAAVRHLEELGYIEDITPGNCPKYRMREALINQLLKK